MFSKSTKLPGVKHPEQPTDFQDVKLELSNTILTIKALRMPTEQEQTGSAWAQVHQQGAGGAGLELVSLYA